MPPHSDLSSSRMSRHLSPLIWNMPWHCRRTSVGGKKHQDACLSSRPIRKRDYECKDVKEEGTQNYVDAQNNGKKTLPPCPRSPPPTPLLPPLLYWGGGGGGGDKMRNNLHNVRVLNERGGGEDGDGGGGIFCLFVFASLLVFCMFVCLCLFRFACVLVFQMEERISWNFHDCQPLKVRQEWMIFFVFNETRLLLT